MTSIKNMNQTPLDPWVHRSEGMRCKSCMWFAPKQAGQFIHLGRCRRHAPSMSGYPVVFVNDWCGDHKLNEAWADNHAIAAELEGGQ